MHDLAAARSRVYRLLAAGLAYPDLEMWNILADGRYAAALVDAHAGLGAGLDSERIGHLAIPGGTLEDLQARYVAAFEVGPQAMRCSLHETDHRAPDDRPALLVELKAFYRCFGLQIGGAGAGMEDHLSVELEFMHFLAFSQSRAGADEVGPLCEAQRDFLRRHLVRWLPDTCAPADQFYAALLAIAVRFVAEDAARLDGQ